MTEPAQQGKARTEPARDTVRRGPGPRGKQHGMRPNASWLQRAAGNRAVNDLLASGGQKLPPALRQDFEQRFGMDFGAVRIHDTPRAGDAANALAAKAFTVGTHIAFGPGRFVPDTTDGKRLLAHELTHVVQQSRGGTTPPTLDGSGPLEADAETAAAAAGEGGGPIAVAGAGAVGIAASPDPAREKPGKDPQTPLTDEQLFDLADKNPILVEGKASHEFDDLFKAANNGLINVETPAEFERQIRFRIAHGSTEYADSWTEQERFEYREFPEQQEATSQSKWDQYVQEKYFSYLRTQAASLGGGSPGPRSGNADPAHPSTPSSGPADANEPLFKRFPHLTPPPDATTKWEQRGSVLVITQVLQREGCISRLTTQVDPNTFQILSRRLARGDDGNWVDVTKDATREGNLSLEWNMPDTRTDAERYKAMQKPGLLYGLMPYHVAPYLRDQTLPIRHPYLRMEAGVTQQKLRALSKRDADLALLAYTSLAPAAIGGLAGGAGDVGPALAGEFSEAVGPEGEAALGPELETALAPDIEAAVTPTTEVPVNAEPAEVPVGEPPAGDFQEPADPAAGASSDAEQPAEAAPAAEDTPTSGAKSATASRPSGPPKGVGRLLQKLAIRAKIAMGGIKDAEVTPNFAAGDSPALVEPDVAATPAATSVADPGAPSVAEPTSSSIGETTSIEASSSATDVGGPSAADTASPNSSPMDVAAPNTGATNTGATNTGATNTGATNTGAPVGARNSTPASTGVAAPTTATAPAAPAANATRRSTRVATNEADFGDAEFDAIVRDARNSQFGQNLEASKRRTPTPLPEDTTRTRAQVDQLAHSRARNNPPPGRVPGAQIQHQTKTLDVTRNLQPGVNPLDADTINENLLWLQSRQNLPSTVLHIDPRGGGTRFYADLVPRGRIGDLGMRVEQLDLFNPSAGLREPDYNTEHKFTDNYLIPETARQIAQSRRDAGLPPLDPRMLAIAAGEQSRWVLTGESGSNRSGDVIDIAAQATARPAEPATPAPAETSPQLELPFGAPPASPAPTPPAVAAPASDPQAAPAPVEPTGTGAPAQAPPSPDITPEPSGTGRSPPAPRSPGTSSGPGGTGGPAPAPSDPGGPAPAPRAPQTPPAPEGGGPPAAPAPEKPTGGPVPPVPDPHPSGSGPAPEKPAPEKKSPSRAQNEPSKAESALHGTTAALNQGAAAVRTYDAYEDARKRGNSVPGAALEAGKTYLENTNVVAGALANYEAKKKDGQDPIEAALSAGGETIGQFIVPGKGWDQAINAVDNLAGAVDDHQKRGDRNAAANADKSNYRTATDLAAGLTPSRMFSGLMGAGLRSYWDIGKAAGGDPSGVDKFADDAVRGKTAMIIQPWAMAADFLGNLGSGEGAEKALDKTLRKTKGSTLEKAGSASGDELYELGQSDAAKSGQYGAPVQGIAMLLSATSDHIAGKSWEQAFSKAAEPGKGSLLAKVGNAGGDAAWAAHEKLVEVTDTDIPAMKAAVQEKLDEAKATVAEFKDEAKAGVRELKEAASDKWNSLKKGAASYLPSW